jgi:hypothetical protein
MSRRLAAAVTGLTLIAAWNAPGAGAASAPSVTVVQSLALGAVAPASTSAPSQVPPGAEPASCTRVGRAEQDRPDIHDGPLVHVVYMLPAGTKDEELDIDGTLACTVAAQNDWMRAQSGLEWRWDTAIVDTASPSDPNARVETVDVTFVRSTRAADALDSAGEVSAELILRGLDEADKRYLTYVASGGSSGVCGDAFYPLDHNFSGDVDGQFSQVYLDSVAGCGARLFGSPSSGGGTSDAIAQQELIHNDGMTPIGAPHTCTNPVPLGHICTGPLYVTPSLDPDGVDVMFPYVNGPLREKVLDRGHDDYFRHPLPIADLADSHYLQPKDAWGKPFVQPRSTGPGPSSSPSPQGEGSGDSGGTGARSVDASASRRRVRAGSRVAIAGSLSGEASCIASQKVVLHRRAVGGGRTLPQLNATSDAEGSFSFRVPVKRSTRFVVVAPATESCAKATSTPVVVTTR